ncbi:dimethylarginine dimethylaminohydrolase family protein [Raoultella ornithinolytica]|jgi:dimethylargininase|uniref:Amidinotransferase n=2 Tax=Raoultella TaxID=160674 RepID=A0A1Y6GK16_RAOOR|nr:MULTISPECIES: amidinotransferase [Raoultella]HBQ8757579.1 amidinotransferase [Klebsiella quasipneumoniae]HBR0921866.1 amidinotransferase [Klebsiella quasipneumoniae subsp. quasipneumoniae]AOO55170.1 amidinotransferase [Raoultella ornithinolytica]APB06831.1 amidinotransferase [Raoultella ornithinolytica]ASI59930.1 amidinotransferase [Raoultella ornithinolytica]
MHFNQAIARLPAATCAAGQTTARLGAPDIAGTTRQFLAYVETLLQLGLKVTVLPAAADYPDAHFVEDTAVVMPELAVITHPGAPSRQGEVASIAPVLAGFRPLVHMSERGHMDGGDVLLVGKQFFVGQTARTDEQGIREFAAAVEPHGYQVTSIDVSAGLHLKSIVNYVGRNTLLLTEGYVNHPAFSGFNTIVIPEEESYAGNTLWINDTLITPQGYPYTLGEISKLGMPVVQLDTSEFKKMDGGLTCLSLRF